MSLSKLKFYINFLGIILGIIIVLTANFWSWELLSFSPFLFLLILSSSIFLYLSIIKSSKKFLYIFCLTLIPGLVIQWKTTNNAGLDYMSITDEHLFATRRSELSKIAPNLGRYLGNKPLYMFHKFEQNLLRNMDLNLYFFGSHPRERSGIREFEKFPFLYLPFLIFGLLKILKLAPHQISISFLIPLLGLSIIGQENPLGPFILFPFFATTIAIGVSDVIKKYLLIQ